MRLQQARKHDDVAASDDFSDGDLDFEHEVFIRISMTGAFLPTTITGDVRAEQTVDGGVITASTSLINLLVGLVLSFVGITVFFSLAGLSMTKFYWIWVGLAAVATGVHLLQAASALRRMTAAAANL